MNMREFATLKVGDKVEVPHTNSAGKITETKTDGVMVTWGPHFDGGIPFFYSVNSTAWMHWTKVTELDEALDDFVAAKPKDIMK